MAKPPTDPKDIAASSALREIWNRKRKELGLTQEKAAHELGFRTQAGVSHYLNGRTPLNTDVILKFAALLQVDPTAIRPDIGELLAPLTTRPSASSGSSGEAEAFAELPQELVSAYLQGGESKKAALLRLADLPEEEMATMLLVLQSIAAKYNK